MSTSGEPQQAYTIKQFCKQFGISPATFYREAAAGRIATRKIGRHTLIRAEDAKAWLDGLPIGTAA